MSYIGSTPTQQAYTAAVDYFNGNASTTAFTLSRPVASVMQMIVVIENVPQNPSSAYTVSGNTITFTSAPPSGTNNIWVEYTSPITQVNALSQSPSIVGDVNASGGIYALGAFNSAYTDGMVMDYVTGNGRLTVGAADGFTIYNGGTTNRTALTTWTAAGNVGIGTTNPGQLLDISTTTGDIQLRVGNSVTGSQFTYDIGRVASTGLLQFYGNQNNATGYIFGGINGERMRITSTGNVGIGTTAPITKFDTVVTTGSSIAVRPTAGSGNAFQTGIRLYGDEATSTSRYVEVGCYNGGGTNINSMVFNTCYATTVSESMRIDGATGSLILAGTTSPSGARQFIYASTSNSGLTIQVGTNGNYACNFYNQSGTNVGGCVANSASVTYATTSDYRLKDNVVPMIGALATVAQLKPVTYKWKADGSDGQGFIAHELQAVVPDCVTGEKDAVDEEGNPKYQGIDTSFLIATLTAALQELKAEVDALKAGK